MSVIKKRRGTNSFLDDDRNTVTASMFLQTYISAQVLLNFVDTGRVDDVESMETYINGVKEKRQYAFSRQIRKDRGGLTYKWIEFQESKGTEGTKVALLEKMDQFILDYHRGNVTINFTFEELVTEAEKV